MSERERLLRAVHDAQPGITSRALARTGVYGRFAARVPAGRVLDLACGDGALSELLGGACIGVDVSAGELDAARRRARARGPATTPAFVRARAQELPFANGTTPAVVRARAQELPLAHGTTPAFVRARAQELPFADASFDAAACQLAFMLLDDIERGVAELARVLRPGAPFLALLGGGPTADGDDAFHRFARLLPRGTGFGDPRASSEAGWRELFAGWRDLEVERWPLDLSGRFEDVWQFLGASYQLPASEHERVRAELRASCPGDHVPCTVVTYFARVTR